MSGFNNDVLYCTGERLEASSAQAISLMQVLASDVSRINNVGNPNGVVSANPSSLCHDPVSGILWLKASGSGNTGWAAVEAGAATINTFTTNVSGPVVPIGGAVAVTGTNVYSNGSVANTLTLNMQGTVNTLFVGAGTHTPATNLATANNGLLITSSSGVPSILADGTTGQVLTATTGSPPSWVSPATSGTVTSVSVTSANGFAGTVATATTTPAITLTTTQTGLLTGNGTSITGTAITQYNVITGDVTNLPFSVAPAAAGTVLTSNGASAQPTFQALGNAPTANSVVSVVDDFIGVTSPSTGAICSTSSWTMASNHFGSTSGTTVAGHPGVIYGQSVSATNAIYLNALSGNSAGIVLGGGVVSCNWVFMINAVSSGTNRYIINFGLGGATSGSDQTDGCYLRYTDNVNSGQWQIVTAAASSLTTTSTSTAFTANVWHNVGVVVNAAATSVQFFVDGVSMGSIITNIPTNQVAPTVKLNCTVGTVASNSLAVDLMYLNIALTTAR